MDKELILEIGDFLGFCDMNGVEAMQTEHVQKLEEYISKCNESYNNGVELVSDAIWDRLIQILKQVNPESELCKYIWEDSTDELKDNDAIIKKNPMYSIQTVKSYECTELKDFVSKLPNTFDMHFSVKLNGHGIRLKYENGVLVEARSRARSSAGRNITPQLSTILGDLTEIDSLKGIDLCEIRGEWLLPFANLDTARAYNSEIKSAFSAVASMGRDSATEEEWSLLRFVAYEFLADGVGFNSKEEEYDFLHDELGFEVPLYWVNCYLTKDSFIEDLKPIMSDIETEVKDKYEYYTDGIVASLNDKNQFVSMGDDGSHYKHGNIALKLGYWEQNLLSGYVQTVLWTKGKSKLSPVAIIGTEPFMLEFSDKHLGYPYIFNQNEIQNWNSLGVISQVGNRIRRIPLYEPANIAMLDAYPGGVLYFRYGGEAGVVPCYSDGTPLVDGKIRDMLSYEYEDL